MSLQEKWDLRNGEAGGNEGRGGSGSGENERRGSRGSEKK